MLKMKTPRTRHEEHDFGLSFDSVKYPGPGLLFDCDEQGNVAPLKEGSPAAANFERAQDRTLYREPTIEKFVRRWVSPAVGTCTCGEDVQLDDPLTNLCSCGRAYNMSGQEVDPGWRGYGEEY